MFSDLEALKAARAVLDDDPARGRDETRRRWPRSLVPDDELTRRASVLADGITRSDRGEGTTWLRPGDDTDLDELRARLTALAPGRTFRVVRDKNEIRVPFDPPTDEDAFVSSCVAGIGLRVDQPSPFVLHVDPRHPSEPPAKHRWADPEVRFPATGHAAGPDPASGRPLTPPALAAALMDRVVAGAAERFPDHEFHWRYTHHADGSIADAVVLASVRGGGLPGAPDPTAPLGVDLKAG